MVDPWYNSNIRSLGYMIPEMVRKHPQETKAQEERDPRLLLCVSNVLQQQANPGRSKDHFVSDVISYYIRLGQQPVYFTIYFVKVAFDVLMGENRGALWTTFDKVPHFSFRSHSQEIKGILSKKYFSPI